MEHTIWKVAYGSIYMELSILSLLVETIASYILKKNSIIKIINKIGYCK